MKRKVVWLITLTIWITLVGCLLFRVYDYYTVKSYESTEIVSEDIDRIDEVLVVAPPESTENMERITRLSDLDLSDNVVGWIEIPGLPINDPLLQTSNNEFYLTHNEFDNYHHRGAYFANHLNEVEDIMSLDRVTTIFGHANGNATSPKFAYLKMLKDPEYANNCRTINIWFGESKTIWRIFAAGDFPVSTEENNYMIPNPGDSYFEQELLQMKNHSYHDYEVEVSGKNQILVLSTCTGVDQYETRFIVCAKLVSIGVDSRTQLS